MLPKLSDFPNNKGRDCPEKLMSDTFSSVTSIALVPLTKGAACVILTYAIFWTSKHLSYLI